MRYRLQFNVNENMVSIHVDKLVCKSLKMWDDLRFGPKKPQFVRDLFGIEGVCEVSIQPYEVGVTKGGVFEWKEMVSAILHTLQVGLDPDGELVEAAPPTITRLDSRGYAMDVPLSITSMKS